MTTEIKRARVIDRLQESLIKEPKDLTEFFANEQVSDIIKTINEYVGLYEQKRIERLALLRFPESED